MGVVGVPAEAGCVLTGLFLETGREVARQYAGRIEMNDRLVDACAMELVSDLWQFY